MGRLKKLKKIRIHREGTHTLAGSLLLILAVNAGLYFGLECKIPFYVVAVISLIVYHGFHIYESGQCTCQLVPGRRNREVGVSPER